MENKIDTSAWNAEKWWQATVSISQLENGDASHKPEEYAALLAEMNQWCQKNDGIVVLLENVYTAQKIGETEYCVERDDGTIGSYARYKFSEEATPAEEEIVRGWDGNFYYKSKCPAMPQEVKANSIRAKRDQYLVKYVDNIVLNPLRWADMSEAQQQKIKDYRRYLLDIPQDETFPDVEVKNFDEWSLNYGGSIDA